MNVLKTIKMLERDLEKVVEDLEHCYKDQALAPTKFNEISYLQVKMWHRFDVDRNHLRNILRELKRLSEQIEKKYR